MSSAVFLFHNPGDDQVSNRSSTSSGQYAMLTSPPALLRESTGQSSVGKKSQEATGWTRALPFRRSST
jgi:hypothetical protein